MGLFDWLFGQKQIDPQKAPLETEWAMPVLMDWIFSGFTKRDDGQYVLNDLPKFPGALNPNAPQNSATYPDVNAMWHYAASSPAMQQLNNFVSQGGYKLPEIEGGRLENIMATGGQGGRPTDRMNEIANYGGVAGPNLEAMKALMTYGAASPEAGQYMSNIAQFGIPSEAGRIMHNRAMGLPTAAQNFLSYYMPKGGGK